MKASNKWLGTVAMFASPFLFLQMSVGSKANDYNTSLGGLFDLVYMIGWMCSLLGLQQMKALPAKKFGGILFQVQLALLFLANAWNVWVIFDPVNKSQLFFVLDMCWPLSNLCLLVLGITIAAGGSLKGWQKYTVLMAGLWLPVAFASLMIFGRGTTSLFISGIYSTIAWFVMGWMISVSPAPAKKSLQWAIS